jgi:hypothetical protein
MLAEEDTVERGWDDERAFPPLRSLLFLRRPGGLEVLLANASE